MVRVFFRCPKLEYLLKTKKNLIREKMSKKKHFKKFKKKPFDLFVNEMCHNDGHHFLQHI